MVSLTIDGRETTVPEGTLVIEAAKQLDIEIPHVCYYKHILPYGGCRVCLVEIERMPKLQTSCTTRVAEGMVVSTNTPEVIKARQGQIEFLLANHPLECPVCDKGGECELQDLSYHYGRGESRFQEEKRHSEDYDFGPLVQRNMDRCVRCKRCIRFMDEIAGDHALNFGGRGASAVVNTFNSGRFNSKFSGNTVTICPVGALLPKPSVHKARIWEPTHFSTVCPHCAVGCNISVAVRRNTVLRHIARENPDVNGAWLCDKGQFGFQFVNSANRVDTPLIRKNGKLVPISWDKALGEIADRLKEIKEANGPGAIGGIGSIKCTNEDNYVFQKFMRVAVGTNNVDHRVNLKRTAGTGGLNKVFDYEAGTASLKALSNAKAIMLFGTDIAQELPVAALRIREAVVLHNAHLVTANTREVDYNRYSHDWLRHLPGTEIPLINGIISVILSEELENREYIEARTDGIASLKKSVGDYTPAKVEKLSGVPEAVLQEVAGSFAQADGGVILYGHDVLEHPHSDDIVRALANLAIITGNVGKSNGGVHPVVTDNNSQGAIDMGVLPDLLPGHLPVGDAVNRQAFSEAWNAEIPAEPGLGTSEMLSAVPQGTMKALYIMGADPIADFPDASLAREALEKIDFLVVHDLFLTETAKLADVVLPGESYVDKDGTFTSFERRVQQIGQGIATVGRRAEWHAVSSLAGLMGPGFPYQSAAEVMEEVSRLVHIYGSMKHEWLLDGSLQWPCPTFEHPGTPVLYSEEYEFSKWKPQPVEYKPLPTGSPEYPMLLLTRRLLFDGGTLVQNSPAIRGLVPEAWIDLNPRDARDLRVSDGDRVTVSSPKGTIAARAAVTRACPAGIVVVPVRMRDAPANVLTDKEQEADYVQIDRAE